MSETLTPENIPNTGTALQHQSPFRKWGGLGVLSLGLAIVIIDTTLLNVSLSYIIRDLKTDIQSLQWVITSYALVLAALTITGGRLGDLFGRRKMFMLGAVIFAVGSFIASVSHNMPTLLLGESIIEGIGAALMMPATASLVVANFKGRDRATAFGVWGGVAGASSAIGPLLGGWLATHYSWRWGFRINVFIAAIVLIGSILMIAESRDEHKPTLDWLGVFLSALGLLGITYGIIESSTYGWWKAKEIFSLAGHQISFGGISVTPVAMAAGFVLLILFLVWEKGVEARGKSPLVSLSLFKNRQFTSGTLTISIMTLGMTGTFFALPIYLQAVKNLDAFHTGLIFLPLSASLLVVAPLTGLLSRKIAPKYLIQFGLLLAAVGALVIRAGITPDGGTLRLLPGLITFGVGMGFVFAPISGLTLSAVPVEQAGEASGVNNTMRQVGASLGAAIVGAAVITLISASLAKGIQNSPVIPDTAKPQLIQKFSNVNSDVEFGGAKSGTAGAPPQVTNEVQALAKDATTKATRDGYLYAAMFILLGFAASLFVPKTDVHDEEQHLNGEAFAEDPHRARKFAGAFAVAVVAIGGGIFLLRQSSAQVITTGTTAQQIRDSLKPAAASDSGQVSLFPENHRSPAPLASSAAKTQTPAGTVYSNKKYNFSLTLSPFWTASENPDGHNVMLRGPDGAFVTIQAYDNVSDLSQVRQTLAGSPSVTNLTDGVFAGNPELVFTVPSLAAQGWAFVHSGMLYYIIGKNPAGSPIASIKFNS